MVGTASRVLGVFVGCLTGMLSLLFMDLDKAERERRKQELDTIFKTVVVHGRRLLHAENCRSVASRDSRKKQTAPVLMVDPPLTGTDLSGLLQRSCLARVRLVLKYAQT